MINKIKFNLDGVGKQITFEGSLVMTKSLAEICVMHHMGFKYPGSYREQWENILENGYPAKTPLGDINNVTFTKA